MGIFDFFKKKKEDDVEAVTKPEEATLPAGMKSIEEQMKEKQGITEELKARDPMA